MDSRTGISCEGPKLDYIEQAGMDDVVSSCRILLFFIHPSSVLPCSTNTSCLRLSLLLPVSDVVTLRTVTPSLCPPPPPLPHLPVSPFPRTAFPLLSVTVETLCSFSTPPPQTTTRSSHSLLLTTLLNTPLWTCLETHCLPFRPFTLPPDQVMISTETSKNL